MTGQELAAEFDLDDGPGPHLVEDGRAAVLSGYAVGQSSILVPNAMISRPMGSGVWLATLSPRVPGDGPSYRVPAWVLARFVPGIVPPSPPAAQLSEEATRHAASLLKNDLLSRESEDRYWFGGLKADAGQMLPEAARLVGSVVGTVASVAIRGVTQVIGGTAGAAYGALPGWVQVAIPVGVALALAAGAAAIVRSVRGGGAV